MTPRNKNIFGGILCGAGLLLFIAVIVIVAPVIGMFGVIIGPMIIYRNDARNTEAQVRSTMNPDDLRKWAWELLQKYPDDSLNYKRVLSDQLPEDLPQLGHRMHVAMFHNSSNGFSRVDIVWHSRGGSALQLIIHLNADGSPWNESDYDRKWAPGISFHTLHK